MNQRISVLLLAVLLPSMSSFSSAQEADDLLSLSGVSGGLVLELGAAADGELTAALHQEGDFVVYALTDQPGNAEKARQVLKSKGVYGPVSVEVFQGSQLPLVDNLINLVVVHEDLGISEKEIDRVLCPRGVALFREGDTWKKTVKDVPEDIDDWTHFFHGADGNAKDRTRHAVRSDPVPEMEKPRSREFVNHLRWFYFTYPRYKKTPLRGAILYLVVMGGIDSDRLMAILTPLGRLRRPKRYRVL